MFQFWWLWPNPINSVLSGVTNWQDNTFKGGFCRLTILSRPTPSELEETKFKALKLRNCIPIIKLVEMIHFPIFSNSRNSSHFVLYF